MVIAIEESVGSKTSAGQLPGAESVDSSTSSFKVYLIGSIDEKPEPFREAVNSDSPYTVKTKDKVLRQLFYTRLSFPLPKRVVVLGWGDWPFSEDCSLEIHLQVSSDVSPKVIGELSKANPCFSLNMNFTKKDKICAKAAANDDRLAKIMIMSKQKAKNMSIDQFFFVAASPKLDADANEMDVDSLNPSVPVEQAKSPVDVEKLPNPVSEKMDSSASEKAGCAQSTSAEAKGTKRPAGETDSASTKKATLKKSERTPASKTQATLTQKSSKNVPRGRWGHSLTAVDGCKLILFGGQGEREKLVEDQLWCFSPPENQEDVFYPSKWSYEKIEVKGNPPGTRMGHSATYAKKDQCVYLFGGSKYKKWFNTVHKLDIHTMNWEEVKINPKPPSVAYHSAVLFRDEIYMFGGVMMNDCNNSLRIFSIENSNIYEPIITGEKPSPRSGHSAVIVSPEKDGVPQMILFGGWNEPVCYNDLFVLDLTMMEFSKVQAKGKIPPPRTWHVSCCLQNRYMFIFGGFDGSTALNDVYMLDINTWTWYQVDEDTVNKAGDPEDLNLRFTAHKRAGLASTEFSNTHSLGSSDFVFPEMIALCGGGDNEGWWGSDIIFIPHSRINAVIDSIITHGSA
eukprot:Nk52_evm7s301 gene=Nk52_evmTU7s301